MGSKVDGSELLSGFHALKCGKLNYFPVFEWNSGKQLYYSPALIDSADNVFTNSLQVHPKNMLNIHQR